MKIVKNNCFGGFSLSPKAIVRYAELKGKKAYFFKLDFKGLEDRYTLLTTEEAEKAFFFIVYSVPNPQDYKIDVRDEDGLYKSANKRAEEISIEVKDRADPDLIKVVEELGSGHRKGASGKCADLVIVEIPDGIKYEIDEYDGLETIREQHRSW